MVIESFIDPVRAERRPWRMFFIGALIATAAVFLSLWIFRQYSSLVMVFLTVTATVPLMYKTMKFEEKKDMDIKDESKLLKEHWRALEFLLFMFLGYLIAYVIWFIVLPADLVQLLFSSQIETIGLINSKVTGTMVVQSSVLAQIFFNNVKVLMFCIFFAFFYGAGAIFILTWNASVISAAIGTFIKNKIAEYAAAIGALNFFQYFHVFSLGLLRYSLHGIPEIAAYFIGGIAGGIISVAMINHDIESEKFKNIMLDVLDLTMLAVFVLFISALIEVFITPLFF